MAFHFIISLKKLISRTIGKEIPSSILKSPKQKKTHYNIYKKPQWFKRNVVEVSTISCGLLVINLIFIAKAYRETNTINPTVAGQLGDFIGGYIGTFFALVSVVFLFTTLKEQRHTTAIEGFTTKYFELIKMHRDNVAEMSLGDCHGKKIFVMLIREFRIILSISKFIAKKHEQKLSQEQLFIIAYYALFFGVGPNSSRMLVAALETEYDKKFISELEFFLNTPEIKYKAKRLRNLSYTPFEGHQSRLGHYFRQLYQTVTYVDNHGCNVDKYDYIKTVRAQLTTHEQALLFINCLTPIGKKWWQKNLIVGYKFVKNIPHGFFNSSKEIDIVKYFPEDYFEWQERINTTSLLQPT